MPSTPEAEEGQLGGSVQDEAGAKKKVMMGKIIAMVLLLGILHNPYPS
jgi:hypothetical protein